VLPTTGITGRERGKSGAETEKTGSVPCNTKRKPTTATVCRLVPREATQGRPLGRERSGGGKASGGEQTPPYAVKWQNVGKAASGPHGKENGRQTLEKNPPLCCQTAMTAKRTSPKGVSGVPCRASGTSFLEKGSTAYGFRETKNSCRGDCAPRALCKYPRPAQVQKGGYRKRLYWGWQYGCEGAPHGGVVWCRKLVVNVVGKPTMGGAKEGSVTTPPHGKRNRNIHP